MPPSWMPAAHDGIVAAGSGSSTTVPSFRPTSTCSTTRTTTIASPSSRYSRNARAHGELAAPRGDDEAGHGQQEPQQQRVGRRARGRGQTERPDPPGARVHRPRQRGHHVIVVPRSSSCARQPARVGARAPSPGHGRGGPGEEQHERAAEQRRQRRARGVVDLPQGGRLLPLHRGAGGGRTDGGGAGRVRGGRGRGGGCGRRGSGGRARGTGGRGHRGGAARRRPGWSA